LNCSRSLVITSEETIIAVAFNESSVKGAGRCGYAMVLNVSGVSGVHVVVSASRAVALAHSISDDPLNTRWACYTFTVACLRIVHREGLIHAASTVFVLSVEFTVSARRYYHASVKTYFVVREIIIAEAFTIVVIKVSTLAFRRLHAASLD
jgi:hypothetical protein